MTFDPASAGAYDEVNELPEGWLFFPLADLVAVWEHCGNDTPAEGEVEAALAHRVIMAHRRRSEVTDKSSANEYMCQVYDRRVASGKDVRAIAQVLEVVELMDRLDRRL